MGTNSKTIVPTFTGDTTGMTIGNNFKLILNYDVGSTPMQNVFHYEQTLGITGGAEMAQEFINEVLPSILEIMHATAVMSNVEWLNYDNLGDFGINDTIAGQVGGQPGAALPRFNAWAFQYNRETRATRNGAKRFSPIAELDQNNGAPDGSALPRLEACADQLEEQLNLGITEIWEPIIARLNEDGSQVLIANRVQSVSFKRLSTQNSRKPF